MEGRDDDIEGIEVDTSAWEISSPSSFPRAAGERNRYDCRNIQAGAEYDHPVAYPVEGITFLSADENMTPLQEYCCLH